MNNHGLPRLTISIVLIALFLSACGAPATIDSTAAPTSVPPTITPTSAPPTTTPTSVPPTVAEAFPTGLWFDCPDCGGNLEGYTQIYYDDGTLIVYYRGEEELRGRWYVEGDILHMGDTWCHDEDTMPASYRWHFDGEFLIQERVQDYCVDRIDSMDDKPWRLIETSQTFSGIYSANDGDYILEFGDDNSFTFSSDGTYNASGTFSTTGDEITWETDSYCDQRSSGEATY